MRQKAEPKPNKFGSFVKPLFSAIRRQGGEGCQPVQGGEMVASWRVNPDQHHAEANFTRLLPYCPAARLAA